MPRRARPGRLRYVPTNWQQVQTLGVTEVVTAILRARKTLPSATSAAVSRESHGTGFRVHVHLLDGTEPPEDHYTPEGAVAIFLARELGTDLAEAFGGSDVIVLG
jgi:hypothetical protein